MYDNAPLKSGVKTLKFKIYPFLFVLFDKWNLIKKFQ